MIVQSLQFEPNTGVREILLQFVKLFHDGMVHIFCLSEVQGDILLFLYSKSDQLSAKQDPVTKHGRVSSPNHSVIV